MHSRCVKTLLFALLSLAAAWGTVDSMTIGATQGDPAQTEIAARYHLRTRTSKFYQRSKTSQVRKSRPA